MDTTSFDLLCKGLSPDEAKLFRKILKEWCCGDEDSFPVQLALLTKTQWLAAAQMVVTLQKIVTAFEGRFDDYEKRIDTTVKKMANAGGEKIKVFEESIAVHTEAMKQVASKSHYHLKETEGFAHEIRRQLEFGLRESERITKGFFEEKRELEQARHDYERSIEWREMALQFFALMIAVVIGFIIGWYFFTRPH